MRILSEIVIYYEPSETQRLWWTGKQFSQDANAAKGYRGDQLPVVQRLLNARGHRGKKIGTCPVDEVE